MPVTKTSLLHMSRIQGKVMTITTEDNNNSYRIVKTDVLCANKK